MSNETKTTYTLEMRSPTDLRPKEVDLPGLRIERMEVPCPEFNKFLRTVIGSAYRWGLRGWSREEWIAFANRKDVETWVAYQQGTPVGYFELAKDHDDVVEILNLGLMPAYIGRRLGGHLLTVAVRRAWEWGAVRVWLHTCSHDHPHALNNYMARGFELVSTVQEPANPPRRSFWELVLESE
jgi:GNAT superfamily N-acetyltransferase